MSEAPFFHTLAHMQTRVGKFQRFIYTEGQLKYCKDYIHDDEDRPEKYKGNLHQNFVIHPGRYLPLYLYHAKLSHVTPLK